MICPNCGRELPDTVRVCPGCSAVQRVHRRRQADAELPEESGPARVTRRVEPGAQAAGQAAGQTADQKEKPAGSSRKTAAPERPPEAGRRSASAGSPAGRQTQVRHVRRAQEYTRRKVDAQPAMMNPPFYPKSHKRLLLPGFIILLFLVVILSVSSYIIFGTENGKRLRVNWGWSVSDTGVYISMSRELLEQAYFTRTLELLEKALEIEPENAEARVLMGQAYTELGRTDEAIAIYKKVIEDTPTYPNAYRNLIRIYQQQGYNAEALAMMKVAADNVTTPQEFDVMLREYTPHAPMLSHPEGRYNEEIDVTLTIPEGQTVYYSTDGTDPSESGLIYTAGTEIHVPEGKMTLKAIGFTENGIPSEQVTANYTIIIPTPAAPKANYASGKYKKAPKVSLRPGSEDQKENDRIVAIYYTLDGRQATTDSTLYTGPIQLPIGDSRLRAIAVADNGKISYEMNVTYKVEGNLKNMFNANDSFKNMELYKTGYKTFTKEWGAPESYEVLPKEQWYSPDMESYEAVYSWGTARFCIKTAGGSPVLYALDTTSSKMTAPRTTRVGMSSEEVLGKFRDLGQAPLDESGNRLLYNYNSANVQFGTFRKEASGNFAIHYYYPVGESHEIFVELSYYLNKEGKVERIVWQRYLSELTGETG